MSVYLDTFGSSRAGIGNGVVVKARDMRMIL
jgi:hypothetical protein